jgi:hypothetical protein
MVILLSVVVLCGGAVSRLAEVVGGYLWRRTLRRFLVSMRIAYSPVMTKGAISQISNASIILDALHFLGY